MTSTKPYLVRAFNEWILDNELTPYLLLDANYPNVHVPNEYVEGGRIVFNITPGIVSMLNITNDVIEFEARFAGRKRHVYAPIQAVLAIYAKENGQGMVFEAEEDITAEDSKPEHQDMDKDTLSGPDKDGPDDGGGGSSRKKSKPNLKIVK